MVKENERMYFSSEANDFEIGILYLDKLTFRYREKEDIFKHVCYIWFMVFLILLWSKKKMRA